MPINMEESWLRILEKEFESAYFLGLTEFLEEEKQKGVLVYPPEHEIFSAFSYTPFHDVKVVILGQDPYHGKGQANGLCFSVNEGKAHPPSLQNIFKELESDCRIPYPVSGNLVSWAEQGVLLLNASLTVRAGEAGSHQRRGWEQFTDAVIAALNKERTGIVFLLWGAYARKKGKHIDRSTHLVLESGHPSPLSANKGHWFGNKHFSRCNAHLLRLGKTEINWSLTPQSAVDRHSLPSISRM